MSNTGHLVWPYGCNAWTTVSCRTKTLEGLLYLPTVLLVTQFWAWKYVCLLKFIIHTFHTLHCSVVDANISMGLFLCEPSASVEHLNASWMILDAFGRIIENQCISEQHSLAVRNIQASFGLWNSIPQPNLNSNKQLWIYSWLKARTHLQRICKASDMNFETWHVLCYTHVSNRLLTLTY